VDVAKTFPDIRLYANDLDKTIHSFWFVIGEGSEKSFLSLLKKVETKPTIKLFKELRSRKPSGVVDLAYRAIFFNRCTFSGIANASPIGGWNQTSKWTVDCRYNASKLASDLIELRLLLKGRLTTSNKSVIDYLRYTVNEGVFYLDPPYYEKGKMLYPVHMTKEEHEQLAEELLPRQNWVLSYDNNPDIHRLYSHAHVESVAVNYSIDGKKTGWKNKNELIITPIKETHVHN
jgi:DNA adenine methylase